MIKRIKSKPYLFIITGFLLVIFIGTVLLKLPFSISKGQTLSWSNAFFTSCSAVCVTGLSTINVGETLSVFGEAVLAILIQIGGFGVVTLASAFLLLIGGKIGINDRLLMRESLNQNSLTGLVKLIKFIVKVTFFTEVIGAIICFFVFKNDYSFGRAICISIFHSISSFNNAGFDILGNGDSLMQYSNNFLLNFTTSLLIVFGGIGFIVIMDLFEKKRYKKISTHSKIVLKMTAFLIVAGAIIIKLTSNADWMQSIFQSISTRTAGFNTVDISSMGKACLLIIMFLMLIGASPCSTGGGIKTTTVYTLAKSVTSYAKGRETLSHHRKISDLSVRKAFLITFLALGIIFFATFLLLIIENEKFTFLEICFEIVSAFGTVGLSLGITSSLSVSSKIIISVVMIFGRVGPLTIISITNKNWNKDGANMVTYLEEKIIIG